MSMFENIPEPSVEEWEERYITADCGHEVYGCECLFTWEDGETLCPECMEKKFNEMSLTEKADLLSCAWTRVLF